MTQARRIAALERELAEARDAVRALVDKEVDAVVSPGSAPVLLREAQEALQRSERLTRAIFESSLDAILICDDQGTYVDANPAAETLLGVRRDAVLGRSVADFIEPGFDFAGAWRAFLDAGESGGETTLVRPDGKRRDVEFRAAADILPGRHLSVLRDVSTRRAVERMLVENERRYRLLVEATADVVMLTAPTRIRYVSPSVALLLGYTPEELLGTDGLDLVHPDDRETVVAALRRVLDEPGAPVRAKYRVRSKDGRERIVEGTARNFVAEPLLGGVVTSFHDVTDREAVVEELRRSEASLRESRAVLEKAQTVAQFGTWIWEPPTLEGRTTLSPQAMAICDLDPATFDGRPESFVPRVHPDDVERVFAAFDVAVEEKTPATLEYRLLARDGSVRWARSHAVVEYDASGRASRMLGTTLDITERKRAELELRDSEQRYRRIVETTSEGVLLVDADATITFVNGRFAAMLGYAVHELVGRPASVLLVGSEDADALSPRLERRRAGVAERYELRLRRKDGRTIWVSAAASPLVDAEKRFEGVLSVVSDVTERRRADEVRARLAAIVESSYDAIFSVSLHGTVVSWNGGAERVYGWRADEIVGQSWSVLFPPEASPTFDELLARIRGGDRVADLRATRTRKDGSLVEVTLTTSPLRDRDGTIAGAAIVARDNSEQKRAEHAESALRATEEQLRQAQKLEAIGQLAGGVAHDFNNILSVILGYSSMLLSELPESSAFRDDVAEIQSAGERAGELTRQLLAFSRRQVLVPKDLDLDAVVAGMEKMLRRLLGENVALVLERSRAPALVRADPSQIEQVVMNLAVNARDAMPAGGTLTLATSTRRLSEHEAAALGASAGAYVELVVRDTGEGMAPETRARMFEPFFTTKEKGKGTGLGLSTVFGIVRQSGGHVWAESEPGRGATFHVLLPRLARARSVAPAPAAESRPAAASANETILLCEDDDQVRALVHNVLRHAGYRVLEAANAGEALLIAEQQGDPIHLLLTDVVMPRVGGHQLAERLRAARPELRVLYMSGYTDDTVLQHGVELGRLAFLHKPVTPDALRRKVREVLEARAHLDG